ncbi:MAG: hypothetical protein LBU04_04940 [Christensenellaceae bacterium]|nr:hypothetical protein [Christensenellaceae bacterium]
MTNIIRKLVVFILVFCAIIFSLGIISHSSVVVLALASSTPVIMTPIDIAGHYGEHEGFRYGFDCSPEVERLTYTLDLDYDETPLQGNIELVNKAGGKYGWHTFVENGYYTITAYFYDDESEPVEGTLNINNIDYKTPHHDLNFDRWEYAGSRLNAYSVYVEDRFFAIKPDVSSGLETVIVLLDTQYGESISELIPDNELSEAEKSAKYREITPAVIKNANVDIVSEQTNMSQGSMKYSTYLDFNIDMVSSGAYYLYARDNVGHVLLKKLFDTETGSYLLPWLDPPSNDISQAIEIAESRIANGDLDGYSKIILDELSHTLNKLKLSFHRSDEKDIFDAYVDFDAAMVKYKNAKAKFSLSIEDEELYPGTIRIDNLNNTAVSALIGDTVVASLKLTEYRSGNSEFENIKDKLNLKNVNRIFKIKYLLTINDTEITPSVALKFTLTKPTTFSEIKFVSNKSDGLSEIAISVGGEWIIFDIDTNMGEYYLIVYDEALATDNSNLIIIVIVSSSIALILLCVLGVFMFKAIKTRREKSNSLSNDQSNS